MPPTHISCVSALNEIVWCSLYLLLTSTKYCDIIRECTKKEWQGHCSCIMLVNILCIQLHPRWKYVVINVCRSPSRVCSSHQSLMHFIHLCCMEGMLRSKASSGILHKYLSSKLIVSSGLCTCEELCRHAFGISVNDCWQHQNHARTPRFLLSKGLS